MTRKSPFRHVPGSTFHRDEDRINTIDFRYFDPFTPENRQTVANCKKHSKQKHQLSDKCKHILAILNVQENMLTIDSDDNTMGYSAQGNTPQASEISIDFGDGIPEVGKEYIKRWISNSGMIDNPFSMEYHVHSIDKDTHDINDPHVIMAIPNTDDIEPVKVDETINNFYKNPKDFTNNILKVKIYSRMKDTKEKNALGFQIKNPNEKTVAVIIGDKVMINSEDINKARKATGMGWYKPPKEDTDYDSILSDLEEKILNYQNMAENAKKYTDKEKYEDIAEALYDKYKKIESDKKSEEVKGELEEDIGTEREITDQDIKNREKDLNRSKVNELESAMDFGSYIPENDIGPWTNPIGQTLRALKTPFKSREHIKTVADTHRKNATEKENIKRLKAREKAKRTMEDYNKDLADRKLSYRYEDVDEPVRRNKNGMDVDIPYTTSDGDSTGITPYSKPRKSDKRYNNILPKGNAKLLPKAVPKLREGSPSDIKEPKGNIDTSDFVIKSALKRIKKINGLL